MFAFDKNFQEKKIESFVLKGTSKEEKVLHVCKHQQHYI